MSVPSAARKRILIATASNWPSTAALPRMFNRDGCHVTVLCHPHTTVLHSKFVDAAIFAEGGLDNTIAALKSHLAETRYDHVIAADDPLISALLTRDDKSWLRSWMPFDPADEKLVGFAISKHAFLTVGSEAGLPVADFTMCASPMDLEGAGATFGFPFILKELSGHGGFAVHRVDSPQDALRIWNGCGGVRLAAQRFVHGKVATIDVLWQRGVPRCYMGIYKLGCYPTAFGAASRKKTFSHDTLAELAKAVGSLMRYHGVGSMDILEDASTGKFFVTELNARPTGGSFNLTRKTSNAFARHWREFLDEREPPPTAEDIGFPSRTIPLFPNNWYYLANHANRRHPIHWIRAIETFAVALVQDPPLCMAYSRIFCAYLAGKSPFGLWLKRTLKSTLRLRSKRHPGAL